MALIKKNFEKISVAMAIIVSSLWLLTSFLIFNSLVFNLQASHDICDKSNLRSSIFFSIPTAFTCINADHHDHPNDKQPYRTAFHFQPPKNWINDPNGPMIYKGIYHFFYQYNPHGAVWDKNIIWAHSTSTDLINWKSHDYAIKPSQPYDINGCWSGSATILPTGEPAMLYTGIDSHLNQVQNLATPKNLSDPYLVEWVKSPKNPIMTPTKINKINPSSFRDPSTAWLGKDGIWRVIVGSEQNNSGIVILYTSKDFVQWTKAEDPFYSELNTGMWECPDVFPVSNTSSTYGLDTSSMMIGGRGIKYVFKVSLFDTAHDVYTVGTYDHEEDTYVPDKGSFAKDYGMRYDYGKFYASKTFFDSAKKRRILWAWVNESSSMTHDIQKGWSGVQAIPRSLWLDPSGKQLMQWPVVELEQLRTKQVTSQIKSITKGSVHEISGITSNQADVEITFKIKELTKAETLDPSWTNPQLICTQKDASVQGGIGPFGLLTLASKGLEEYTAVFFRIFKAQNDKYAVLMCSDQSRSSLENDNDKTTYGAFVDIDPLNQELSLRTLIDHSIVESFGGMGKSCITARVYPKLAINEATHLYAFNNGSQSVGVSRLNAWSMKKAIIK